MTWAHGVHAAAWSVDLLFGGAVNADSRLTIQQANEPELAFVARWETRPFDQPLYWGVRAGWIGTRHGWALELLHHKIYLANAHPDVEAFSISHGLNFVTAQYGWLHRRWRLMGALGAAFAHRENTVRGKKLDEVGGLFDAGYEVTGPVLGVGLGTDLGIAGVLRLVLEVRLMQSWIAVDVVDGRARTSNLGAHFLVGPRLRFAGDAAAAPARPGWREQRQAARPAPRGDRATAGGRFP